MSLINDMLKDLDTQRVRRNPGNDAALLGLGLTGHISNATQKSLATVIAVSLVVLSGVFAWPYTTNIFTHPGNHKDLATKTSARETRGLLPAEQSASHEPAERTLPATAVHTEDMPNNNIQAASIKTTDKTQAGSEQQNQSMQPAVQAVRQITEATSIVKRPLSVQERVQRAYQKAVQALRTGQDDTAEQLLGEALTLDSKHHETRLLLASLYIRQQRNIDAETLLASGLARNPGHSPFAKLHAQLLLTQARYREAIQHLQTALPGADRDAEYHAILAGLYQRTGKVPEAVQQYQVALRLMPTKGEWWMGLGISMEQAGNPEKAFAAYQRALQHPLSSPLQQYVNTRIKNLPR